MPVYAWAVFQVLSKHYAGPVRVEAAPKRAVDRDPESEKTPVKAARDKPWKVHDAALNALAQQADPSLMDAFVARLSDRKQPVRWAAAAGRYSCIGCQRTRGLTIRFCLLGTRRLDVRVGSFARLI
jgi:hypothetical protein